MKISSSTSSTSSFFFRCCFCVIVCFFILFFYHASIAQCCELYFTFNILQERTEFRRNLWYSFSWVNTFKTKKCNWSSWICGKHITTDWREQLCYRTALHVESNKWYLRRWNVVLNNYILLLYTSVTHVKLLKTRILLHCYTSVVQCIVYIYM